MIPRTLTVTVEVQRRGRRPAQIVRVLPGCRLHSTADVVGRHQPRGALVGVALLRDAAAVASADRRASAWPPDGTDPWPAARSIAPAPDPPTEAQLARLRRYLRAIGVSL